MPAMMSDELVAQILNLSQTCSIESPCVRRTACALWSPLKMSKRTWSMFMIVSCRNVLRRVAFGQESRDDSRKLFVGMKFNLEGLYRESSRDLSDDSLLYPACHWNLNSVDTYLNSGHVGSTWMFIWPSSRMFFLTTVPPNSLLIIWIP